MFGLERLFKKRTGANKNPNTSKTPQISLTDANKKSVSAARVYIEHLSRKYGSVIPGPLREVISTNAYGTTISGSNPFSEAEIFEAFEASGYDATRPSIDLLEKASREGGLKKGTTYGLLLVDDQPLNMLFGMNILLDRRASSKTIADRLMRDVEKYHPEIAGKEPVFIPLSSLRVEREAESEEYDGLVFRLKPGKEVFGGRQFMPVPRGERYIGSFAFTKILENGLPDPDSIEIGEMGEGKRITTYALNGVYVVGKSPGSGKIHVSHAIEASLPGEYETYYVNKDGELIGVHDGEAIKVNNATNMEDAPHSKKPLQSSAGPIKGMKEPTKRPLPGVQPGKIVPLPDKSG